MPKKSFAYVALGVFALMLGLFAGIFRLMADNGAPDALLTQFYGLHSILMVYGFIATLIMTERVAGLRTLSVKRTLTLTSGFMAPLTWLGSMVYTAGEVSGAKLGLSLGVVLMLIGASAFVATLYMLARLSHLDVPFLYMILSVFSLMLGAVELGFAQPEHDMGMIMLFLCFPVIFIMGERVELMGFLKAVSYRKRFVYSVYALTLSVILFSVSSTLTILGRSGPFTRALTLVGVLPVAVIMVSYYLLERGTFKKLSAAAQPIQKYVVAHTQTAYVWGVIGSVLTAFYLADAPFGRLYDASIHSFAIGFVGTMFLAHGPIIFPTVTGRRLDPSRLNRLPLILLTVATALRVFGDLVAGATHSVAVDTGVWVSGWLILAVVVLFLLTLVRATRASPQHEQESASSNLQVPPESL